MIKSFCHAELVEALEHIRIFLRQAQDDKLRMTSSGFFAMKDMIYELYRTAGDD